MAGAAVGGVGGQQRAKFGMAGVRARNVQQQLNVAEWKRQILRGLSLNSPFELTASSEIIDRLSDGMKGLITEIDAAAKEAGDPIPKYMISGLQISGLDARRGSYSGQPKGRPLRIEAINIQRGQRIWSAMVIFQAESATASAEQVLRSIEIADE